MRYFNHLYIKLCISKNYKKLYYESIQLNDSNKISLDDIFSYTLDSMYKISSNDE